MFRTKALPSMLNHAGRLERQLERHPPDEATSSLNLTGDMVLKSFSWARWQVGIRSPVE